AEQQILGLAAQDEAKPLDEPLPAVAVVDLVAARTASGDGDRARPAEGALLLPGKPGGGAIELRQDVRPELGPVGAEKRIARHRDEGNAFRRRHLAAAADDRPRCGSREAIAGAANEALRGGAAAASAAGREQ